MRHGKPRCAALVAVKKKGVFESYRKLESRQTYLKVVSLET